MRVLTALFLVFWWIGIPTAELKPETNAAFDRYVQQREAVLTAGLHATPFLWVDGAAERRQQVRNGKILVQPAGDKGTFAVPQGLIHDWVAAVFVPRASVQQVVGLLQDYDHLNRVFAPEVVRSHLIRRDGEEFTFSMRLLKKKLLVTAELDTDHLAHYTQLAPARWANFVHSTRIAEVEDADTPQEHDLPPGQGHGFLWRFNTYWRMEQRDGGTYVECEAISLTRDVPQGLGWAVDPVVESLPRESLRDTLAAVRNDLTR